ncbi:hypothetical protein KK137_06360 [Croceibacterium sp. LX-88]|uniref:Terminase small subunit protein n=1 Tax=Croceibacterium selenioxidans TaxID=2838833 RepID=A0ABS5W2I2_9SPHN|nr:hypothetical protein [Croceibacterium selenioxidans]MBT2133952.1 hypothetical protein [Croceibacterium selenioxidans]
MAFREFEDDIIEELLERLSKGESIRSICRDQRMPNASTIWAWSNADDQLAKRILEAREIGYHDLAERTLADVEKCKDPIKARLVFDSRRWFLGKISHSYRDRPVAIGALVSGSDDAFAAVAEALNRASATIASSSHSTQPVVIAGETGSGDAAGRLENMASPRRQGLWQDEGGK